MEVLFIVPILANMICTGLAIPVAVLATLAVYHQGARPAGVATLLAGVLGISLLWLSRVLLSQAGPTDFGLYSVLEALSALWVSGFTCFALPTLLVGLFVLRKKIWPESVAGRKAISNTGHPN